jgi:PAS domain S-box-containing protein
MPDGNLLAMIRDVTARNETQQALRTADEHVRFSLESASVGIWNMDYTSGVLQWSDVMEAQYGLRPGTFGGTFDAFIECVHREDRESVIDVIGKAIRAGSDFSILHRGRWPDGTVRWLCGTGRILLDEGGMPVRAVGISQDVTERHTLEAQFQQAQKMEAVGRLAGGVAHDFNNLLTVILGFCELLAAGVDPDDPRRCDITEIQRAGTRATELTRQLLAFSRRQIVEPSLLDVNGVLSDMRPMLGRLIREDVKLVFGAGPGLAPVKADRGQLEQVIVNLAVNAQDAMPNGGILRIETANIELDTKYTAMHFAVTPGPYVVVTVTDSGTGMTREVRERVFEPFFTTKEVGKGTGLGLAIVHGIVMRNGGSIDVYSELGRGTSFKIYLPRAIAGELLVVAPAPAVPLRPGTETVLVVDDAEALLVLTKRLLEQQGYTVVVAASVQEAIRLFDVTPSIDVLLTDVIMPGRSGPELSKQLLERRPGLPVVYMSGYAGATIVQHRVDKRGAAFLHKPFTADAVGRKIREVLDRPPLHQPVSMAQ